METPGPKCTMRRNFFMSRPGQRGLLKHELALQTGKEKEREKKKRNEGKNLVSARGGTQLRVRRRGASSCASCACGASSATSSASAPFVESRVTPSGVTPDFSIFGDAHPFKRPPRVNSLLEMMSTTCFASALISFSQNRSTSQLFASRTLLTLSSFARTSGRRCQ